MTTPGRQSQRGAALLTAMIIVTLIATLASGMVWQQWRAVQVEVAERGQVQAQWILYGALDWARLILREDARTGEVDHLGEPWSVPLAESRLSTFLAADRNSNTDDGPDAFLSGVIRDAQARYNLRNLVRDGKVLPAELQTLQRLCTLIALPDAIASQLAEAMRRATPGSSADVNAATDGAQGQVPVMPASIDDLGWLGLDAATVTRLLPYVTLLPAATPINLNTASKEVIAAVIGTVDLASAERLVQNRMRSPLRQVEDARAMLGLGPAAALDSARLSVSSRYFEVDGAMRLEQLVVAQRSLLERTPQTREVRVLRSVRVRPSVTAGTSLQQ